MNTKIIETESHLYHKYPNQINPQPAYIEIDEDGEISADTDSEIGGGVPSAVWHGRTLRFTCPIGLTADAANELMEAVQPLAEEMMNHHEIKWDGSNYVGAIDERGRELSDEIERMCREWDGQTVVVWDAWEWIYESRDGEIEQIHNGADDDQIRKWIECDATDCDGNELILENVDNAIARLREMAEEKTPGYLDAYK